MPGKHCATPAPEETRALAASSDGATDGVGVAANVQAVAYALGAPVESMMVHRSERRL